MFWVQKRASLNKLTYSTVIHSSVISGILMLNFNEFSVCTEVSNWATNLNPCLMVVLTRGKQSRNEVMDLKYEC